MKSILLVPAFFLFISSQAQSTVKEFGVGFANFNQFSLQYRWGDGTKFYRINGNLGATFVTADKTTITGNTGTTYVTQTTPTDISTGIGLSVLKLKPTNEKIGWMYGINYSIAFGTRDSKISYGSVPGGQEYKTSTSFIRPSVGVVLGGYFKFSEDFFLYAEIIPNLFYQYSKYNNTDFDPDYGNNHTEGYSSSFGISGLSNSDASMTLVYRFSICPSRL